MTYNTDKYLWENQAQHMRKTALCGTASLLIYQDGSVANGHQIIGRFKNRREARKTLQSAGFEISPQLGMGCNTRCLNARVRAIAP